jgi:hypothetical protein
MARRATPAIAHGKMIAMRVNMPELLSPIKPLGDEAARIGRRGEPAAKHGSQCHPFLLFVR